MPPRTRLPGLLLALCAAAGLSGCGAGAADGRTARAAPAPVALSFTVNHGHGTVRRARLTCRGTSALATGYLGGSAVAACVRARSLAAFLAARPGRGRICTQIYGGPQTARIIGNVGVRRVDRRFSRTDGCQIADWSRAGLLLPRVSGAGAAPARP